MSRATRCHSKRRASMTLQMLEVMLAKIVPARSIQQAI
jgi:hypothetical protein